MFASWKQVTIGAVCLLIAGCGDSAGVVRSDDQPDLPVAELAVAVLPENSDADPFASQLPFPTELVAIVYDVRDGRKGTSVTGPLPLEVTASKTGFEVWVRDLPPGDLWLEVAQIATLPQNKWGPRRVILNRASRRLAVAAGEGQMVFFKEGDFIDSGFDYDGDGIENRDEVIVGTNPFLLDTDADTVADSSDHFPQNRSLR